ncbi:hypothetical protein Nepgr_008879 [Nepenthes gracilis]|uniref:Uncharacterized protein n=1 Tax=Nepenthes gracilis TaxID=150966 RepID=A0AAD3S9X4_NEPGR|nr:hypothetical protein Nepgr_008879 [Nepenthes gracilis]
MAWKVPSADDKAFSPPRATSPLRGSPKERPPLASHGRNSSDHESSRVPIAQLHANALRTGKRFFFVKVSEKWPRQKSGHDS